MLVDVFSIGEYDYENEDKPIHYSDTILKEIAEKTNDVKLTLGHDSDDEVGRLNEFIFEEGVLKANMDLYSDVDIEGKGISPVFKCDTIDKGNHYEVVNPLLSVASIVSNPRSNMYFNNEDGDDLMSDKLQELLNKKEEYISEKNEEIGILKSQLEEARKTISELNETNSLYDERCKALQETIKTNESFEEDAIKYRNYANKKREALIKEISGDNDDKSKEILSKLSIEELEFMKSKTIVTEPHKGVGTEGNDELNDEGNQRVQNELTPEEKFKQWEEENNKLWK